MVIFKKWSKNSEQVGVWSVLRARGQADWLISAKLNFDVRSGVAGITLCVSGHRNADLMAFQVAIGWLTTCTEHPRVAAGQLTPRAN